MPDIEELWLTTSDGVALEAELVVPPDPRAAVVLCHPHPEQGGNMRSIITGTQFRELPDHGAACLRFNFRGVGRSEGAHDRGRGEQLDVVAAIDALHPITEGLPLVVSGWSFGADTSLAVVDERIDGWAPVAPPLRVLPDDELLAALDPRPKRVLVPEHDQFNPPERAEERTSGWLATDLVVAAGGDHFLVGRLGAAVEVVMELLASLSDPPSGA